MVRPSSSQRTLEPAGGQALLLALVVLTLVSTAVALWGSSLQLRLRVGQESVRRVQLGALIDAAMARSLAELAEDARFSGFSEERFGLGSISSEVDRRDTDRRIIRVTARIGSWDRYLDASVRMTPSGPQVTDWQRGRPPDVR